MYIDTQNKVDREGLQQHVFEKLTDFKQVAKRVCVEKQSFWDSAIILVKKTRFGKESEAVVVAIQQLTHLPFYIQMWIDMAVDTLERFDFFVLTKAHEIKSGDQERDYFWAMQIRHDQLVGLVRVLTLLMERLKVWVSHTPQELLDDPVFMGLTEVGIEEQVYLEAEKIYQERQHIKKPV